MTDYSWTILSLEVSRQTQDLNNVVVKVYWIYTAKQGVDSAWHSGFTQLLPPDPSNFTPLDQAQLPEIVQWIESAENMQALQQTVDRLLAESQQKPTYIIPFVAG